MWTQRLFSNPFQTHLHRKLHLLGRLSALHIQVRGRLDKGNGDLVLAQHAVLRFRGTGLGILSFS